MELFGKPVRTGRSVRRLGRAQLDLSVEKEGRGLTVRGTISGRPGRVEVLRLPVPRTFLMNNWQSWGPTQRASPADTFPELEPIHATNPYGFSPLLGELLPRVWSDYFIAWDGAVLGFLASKIAHPFFLVEGAELVLPLAREPVFLTYRGSKAGELLLGMYAKASPGHAAGER